MIIKGVILQKHPQIGDSRDTCNTNCDHVYTGQSCDMDASKAINMIKCLQKDRFRFMWAH